MKLTPYQKHAVLHVGKYSVLIIRDAIEDEDLESLNDVKYIIDVVACFEIEKEEETFWLEQKMSLSYGTDEVTRDNDFEGMDAGDGELLQDILQTCEQMEKLAKQNLQGF